MHRGRLSRARAAASFHGNHLNDIAKDHPQLLVQWLREHLPGATPQRRALLRHACRTLLEQGHPEVLAAWGLGRPLRGEAELSLAPERLAVGDSLQLTLQLRSTAARAQTLLIDYAVHHLEASGARTPKVFKGWLLQLAPHEQCTLHKRHSLRALSTRRCWAGRHELELRINGQVLARAFFELDA
nr:DNA alkylation repair protein [Rubrivivax sp.]